MSNSERNIPVIAEWADYLSQAGHYAPSADNSQPWKFNWDGHSLSLLFNEPIPASMLTREHPVTLLAMGAAIENMVQAAETIGIDTANWEYI